MVSMKAPEDYFKLSGFTEYWSSYFSIKNPKPNNPQNFLFTSPQLKFFNP